MHSQLPVETCTCGLFISRLDRFYLCFCSSYSTTCRNMHLLTRPVFSGVRVTQCLVLSVCFVDRGLSFCSFSFGHCVVCSSSIYIFWLPLWYLQTHLAIQSMSVMRIWTLHKSYSALHATHYIFFLSWFVLAYKYCKWILLNSFLLSHFIKRSHWSWSNEIKHW